jgi:predicted 2-oxoglutarate/Fe(II)-dependent dioxygenase YbiX
MNRYEFFAVTFWIKGMIREYKRTWKVLAFDHRDAERKGKEHLTDRQMSQIYASCTSIITKEEYYA